MYFGIPLLADRVAPRCTFADCVLVVRVKGRRILGESEVPLNGNTWADLVGTLSDQGVDTLICGGIAPATRESIRSRDMEVIENVAGTREEVIRALAQGRIRTGFGLVPEPETTLGSGEGRVGARFPGDLRDPGELRNQGEIGEPGDLRGLGDLRDPGELREPGELRGSREIRDPEEIRGSGNQRGRESISDQSDDMDFPTAAFPSDCLECTNRVCLQGKSCPFLHLPSSSPPDKETQGILESTWDVALEEERTLCRLAELVYFGLEMGYQRLGVAFCEDLREPATILTRVLRRFFEVIPVGCKAHGPDPEAHPGIDPDTYRQFHGTEVPCDPQAVAEILNSKNTDLNVLVGFCAGADCVFNRQSRAPVTTIFVKDKSLANNPIGAVYSHYYLTDI